MVAKIIPVDNFDLVIFGGTGDLSMRKIMPALYCRMLSGQMPRQARVIAVARSNYSNEEFRAIVESVLYKHVDGQLLIKSNIANFLRQINYIKLDISLQSGWQRLKATLRSNVIQVFYLSVAPTLFSMITHSLIKYGLTNTTSRIVVEKPFGHDLASAMTLNTNLRLCFQENQIYRIDHYLGKETVQNLIAIRFGNALFEPLWNARHIDHVQITAAENLGVGGRGTYYDKSGALRDMVQNHLMQLLCLTAMEPPSKFEANAVRDEKLKVIKALKPSQPANIVRGQYDRHGGIRSYVEDCENPHSTTESYVALQVDIANWRWAGVPFYLRTGKRLRCNMTEIVVVFKRPLHSIFHASRNLLSNNILIIRLQPNEGITLGMTIKDSGPGGMRLRDVSLDMSFADTLNKEIAWISNPYERLIMDVIRGNQTLFMRGDEVEAAWEWIDPIILCQHNKPSLYNAGSTGPNDAVLLLHKDGRKWRNII